MAGDCRYIQGLSFLFATWLALTFTVSALANLHCSGDGDHWAGGCYGCSEITRFYWHSERGGICLEYIQWIRDYVLPQLITLQTDGNLVYAFAMCMRTFTRHRRFNFFPRRTTSTTDTELHVNRSTLKTQMLAVSEFWSEHQRPTDCSRTTMTTSGAFNDDV